MGGCDGCAINSPDRVFVKFAFVKFVPSIRVKAKSVFERFAPLASMREPIMYPPFAVVCTYR